MAVTASTIREAEEELGIDIIGFNLRQDGGVEIRVAGAMSPQQIRTLSGMFEGTSVSITPNAASGARPAYTVGDIRGAEEDLGIDISEWSSKDGRVVITVNGDLTPAQTRDLANRFGNDVSVNIARPTATADSAAATGTTGQQAPVTPAADTPTHADELPPAGDTLAAPDTPRQIPGGGEVWRIDGGAVYLAYGIPGTDKKMVWLVENPDRLKAIFGDGPVVYDKELTREEFRRASPWRGGLSAELQNTSEDPWQQFVSDFNAAAELRPWLTDPSVQAVMAVAYLEGRAPTSDELAQTDWWNDHTADERAWMESSATMGREEVQRQQTDAAQLVEEKIREAGMSSPPAGIVEFIARQRLTGKWSEAYTNQQIAKLADPFAPGQLDRGLLAVVRDPNQGSAADAAAIAEGKPEVIRRLRQTFLNARVPIATETETEEARLNRIADEVMSGGRSMSDVRRSIDLIAMKTDGGQIGGVETNAKGEEEVRRLAQTWLGPVHGELSSDQIARWAGRMRNDPSGNVAQEFEAYLKQQRLALFPEYENENLTYEDIVTPWQNYLTQRWGQQVDLGDETLIQVARLNDIGEAGRVARTVGLERNYAPVVNEMATGMLSAFGGGVRRAI